MARDAAQAGAAAPSGGVLAAYALALLGSFVSFMPLLAILLPLKAGALAPSGRAALLAVLLTSGAVAAGAASLVVGALSDRTRGPLGRRRPWIAAGLAGTLLSYAAIAAAERPATLVAATILFQVALNTMLAPLAAVMADAVPPARRGRLGAIAALGVPLGLAGGAQLVAAAGDASYRAIGVLLALSVLPFLLLYRERAPGAAPAEVGRIRPTRAFALAWTVRALFVLVANLFWTCMLFFLQAREGSAEAAVTRLAGLTLIWSGAHIAAGLAAGWLSDRTGRRAPFLAAAGLALAATGATLATGPATPGLIAAMVLLGIGAGTFQALDAAVMTAALPSRRHAAALLGVLNLANLLPQVAAPALAVALLGPGEDGFARLFAAAAALAVLAGASALPLRA